jgi:hypothetical protein
MSLNSREFLMWTERRRGERQRDRETKKDIETELTIKILSKAG